MAAQLGNNVTLGYGPQGSRQLGGNVTLEYQTVVAPRVRVTGGAVRATWANSVALSKPVRATSPATGRVESAKLAPWVRRSPLHAAKPLLWAVPVQASRARTAAWAYRGRAVQPETTLPFSNAAAADRARLAPWANFGRALQPAHAVPWNRAAATDHARLAAWGNTRAVLGTDVRAPARGSAAVGIVQWVPWTRFSRPLQPGWGVPTPPGPTPDPSGTWIVPVQTLYIMLNETTLVRVSDNAVIPTTSLSLNLDADSWTWGFTATVPYSALSLVSDATEVQAAINGETVRLVVESVSRERSFGADWLRISGRGRSAELGAPYSQILTFANSASRTAQQLAGDALLDNGVPLPWTVEWNLTDWLVPAGVWSLQGSRIDALGAIAAAAGGYVQPHNTEQVVRFLARYPTVPWEWDGMTPDYELPAAVVQREGIEWVSKPAYNRVFVSGQRDGVLGQVTRTGTAGDVVAQMVTDPLITHVDAARQRGMAVLGNTGNQALVTLRLPVLEETGLIVPGKSVRYVDGSTTRTGIVRSTAVDVAYVETWQTLKVETHL